MIMAGNVTGLQEGFLERQSKDVPVDLVAVDHEIRRRILLVGPYPRYIIGYRAFIQRVGTIIEKVKTLGITRDSVSLATLNIFRNLQLESGKLQSTYPKDEFRQERVFKLHPLAVYTIACCFAKRQKDFVNAEGKPSLVAFRC